MKHFIHAWCVVVLFLSAMQLVAATYTTPRALNPGGTYELVRDSWTEPAGGSAYDVAPQGLWLRRVASLSRHGKLRERGWPVGPKRSSGTQSVTPVLHSFSDGGNPTRKG